MKKLLTTIAVSAFALLGTAVQADARPQYDHGNHQAPVQTYISNYRDGRPIWVQKTYIGRDSCGIPRYSYRNLTAQQKIAQQARSSASSGHRNSGPSHNHRSSGSFNGFRFGR